MRERDILTPTLREPARVAGYGSSDWERLISQARRAGLVARLAYLLRDRGLFDAVPARPRRHLDSACVVAAKLANDVRWEVRCLRPILARAGVAMVLLKGAAYVLADLPPARGRVFSDVDFMVPRAAIRRIELDLRGWGWLSAPLNAYDQRYYREWSHQIPPLIHGDRQTTIDVHHTIIPETARTHVEAGLVYERTVAVDAGGDLRVLAPEDMVLHSAAHLLNEGEFDSGLRDLLDIADLLSHFGREPAFWPTLAGRAEALGLTRPLYYALRHIERLFGVAPPEPLRAQVAGWRPPAPVGALMDACLKRALHPIHPSCETPLAAASRWLLFVRGHYLRMPMAMLLPHLTCKALRPVLRQWRRAAA